MVYVYSVDSKPLMPCTPAKARHLLEKGKAIKVRTFTRDVFAIQLTFRVSEYVEELTLGIDAGSKVIGFSVSSDRREYFAAEVEVRNDIKQLMTARSKTRRTRRSRLRHRAPRFNNRKRREGWYAPTVENKMGTHLWMIDLICSLLPISHIVIETASFDIQKLKNPEIEGVDYQHGEQYGFWNTREYVLWRDDHQCQNCKGKSKDKVLQVHHIIPRKYGGSDRPDNLITLCSHCHKGFHDETVKLKIKNPEKGYEHEAFMGIMRWEIYHRLQAIYGDMVSMTYGYITKDTRIRHKLPKTHRIDALCIAGHPDAAKLPKVLYCRKLRCHNRQLYKANKRKGGKLKANQAPLFVYGFKIWDKVKYNNQTCFIKGRRSTGYFALETFDGTKVSGGVSYKKLALLESSKTIITEMR